MPIATLGAPQLGAVDGTAAMSAADEGYLFLFNPGFTPLNASLLVDESLDISNASTAGPASTLLQLRTRQLLHVHMCSCHC